MKDFDRHYPIHIQNTDVEEFLAKDGIIREYDNVGQEIIR
jgi:hypothetical protein